MERLRARPDRAERAPPSAELVLILGIKPDLIRGPVAVTVVSTPPEGARHGSPRQPFIVTVAIAALVAFDLLALRFGVDSRGPSATTTHGTPGSDGPATRPMSWTDFAAAAPDIAAEGRRLILARGDGEAILATVRGDDLPRIHPVNVAIVDGRLYAFIIARSPKRLDLELTVATRCTPTRTQPHRARSRCAVTPAASTTGASERASPPAGRSRSTTSTPCSSSTSSRAPRRTTERRRLAAALFGLDAAALAGSAARRDQLVDPLAQPVDVLRVVVDGRLADPPRRLVVRRRKRAQACRIRVRPALACDQQTSHG